MAGMGSSGGSPVFMKGFVMADSGNDPESSFFWNEKWEGPVLGAQRYGHFKFSPLVWFLNDPEDFTVGLIMLQQEAATRMNE